MGHPRSSKSTSTWSEIGVDRSSVEIDTWAVVA